MLGRERPSWFVLKLQKRSLKNHILISRHGRSLIGSDLGQLFSGPGLSDPKYLDSIST